MKTIDNINTLLGKDLASNLNNSSRLKIAASVFSIYAYEALKKELEKIQELQFIFTTPTFLSKNVNGAKAKEKREFIIPQINSEDTLYDTEFEIHLKNKLTQKAIAKECAQWIRRKVRFKSNTSNHVVMQNFISLQNIDKNHIYFPLQSFTPAGLGLERSNAVSNFVTHLSEESYTQQYLHVFNQTWHDKQQLEDVTDQVIQYIESVYQENAPERIYFFMLFNIFKDFLAEVNDDVLPNDLSGYKSSVIWKKLFNFQKDAAQGIINKLETYNGCILADSVGLGKTFTALAVIKYYELRNRNVLVLCPKKLGANWTAYNTNLVTNILAEDRLRYDVLYHTDLTRTSGKTLDIDLSLVNWGNYDLIVIDESHNFRNRDIFKDKETRYDHLMNKLIKQGVKTKVLMLSATPVNNRFIDLKNQLALAYEGNAKLLEDKVNIDRDINTVFSRAQSSFNVWSRLPPAQRTTQAILDLLDIDFFTLLDSVTIARSRKHIQSFYDTSDIGRFPTRLKPISHRCPISTDSDCIPVNELYKCLLKLKMSVYAPVSYVFSSRLVKYEEAFDTQIGDSGKNKLRQKDREKSLQALMRVNLLKRLESSVHAFSLTLSVLQKNIEEVLEKIEQYNTKQQTNDELNISDNLVYDEDDSDELLQSEDVIGKKLKIHLADLDTVRWAVDLSDDLDVIRFLRTQMAEVNEKKDAKLLHLKQLIAQKIQQPINQGNKKIIIFTAFADTADYLYRHLAILLLKEQGIHTAKITGTTNVCTIKTMPNSRKGYDMQGLLTLFSPISKQKHQVFPNESRGIDILIATDCISEGQNLQDCDYLINYDIHWNPVRIIQRFGRIDRIGSPNATIQLVNYWPDVDLDEYINLRNRVESRMVIVDVTSTGDDNVLSSQANDVAYRHEQLKRLQNEVLDLEEANTGVSITDLGLNDFRMDLLHYMQEQPGLDRLPRGLHAVVPADPKNGLPAGVIFTLRSKQEISQAHQTNRLYPYYLIYIDKTGKVIYDFTQAKYLLELVRKACKNLQEPVAAAYEPFNEETDDGRNMQAYSVLLEKAITTIQDIKIEKDIDSLFTGLSTSALESDMQGLNDFELISFIVIEDV